MGKIQVLIVEDDGIIAMDLESRLKSLGYSVPAIVAYGEQAIQKVGEYRPDLVFMDIVLKGEMDGIEAADHIRTRFNIPVVFATAHMDEDRLERAKLTLPFGYVLKPFQDRELKTTIEMALYTFKVNAERRQAEEELKKAKILLERTFESLDEAVFVVDPTTRTIVSANPAIEKIFGYSQEEVIGRNTDFLHVDQAMFEEFGRRLFSSLSASGGYNTEFKMRRKDGSTFFTDHTVKEILDDSGHRVGVVSVVRDIDERKRIEETLRESEEKFRLAFENANHGMTLVGLDGHHLKVNKMLCGMLGYSQEELGGMTVEDTTHPGDLHICGDFVRRALEGEIDSATFEKRHIHKQGHVVWVQIASSLVRDLHGVPLYFISQAIDISEAKRAKEQIKASLKEKELLLREIHHRVKNNMQLIISLLNLQADKFEDKKYADMFKESQNRIKSMSLIHEKLYQTKDFANIDFGEHVKSLVDGLFVSHGVDTSKIRINMKIEDNPFDFENAIPCGLIINELVSNSLKHAFPQKREGKIKVALHSITEDEFELIVSDDGIGFPKDTDFKNTDTMGLHLVKVLAEHQLNGKIDLDRTAGTQFHIKFKRKEHKKRI